MSSTSPKLMIPMRKSYKMATTNIEELPFVIRQGKGKDKINSNWHFPKGLDYGDACQLGNEYATHFMQFMLDNPCRVGANLLGHIVSSIDFQDESGGKGVWVGFFSTLETFLARGANSLDVWEHLEQTTLKIQTILRQRQQEEQS